MMSHIGSVITVMFENGKFANNVAIIWNNIIIRCNIFPTKLANGIHKYARKRVINPVKIISTNKLLTAKLERKNVKFSVLK